MKIFFTLSLALLLFGCAAPKPPEPPRVSGDGSSFEQAVIIQASNESAGVAAEYAWLRARYPIYRLQLQSLQQNGNRAYDRMDIVTPQGPRSVYFDISSFFGK
jgi:hypothetical protein